MKTLIYFFSCFSLMVLVGCEKSPEEKCFDAQMLAWANTPTNERDFKHFLWKFNQPSVYKDDANGKSQYEANAWARCMKK